MYSMPTPRNSTDALGACAIHTHHPHPTPSSSVRDHQQNTPGAPNPDPPRCPPLPVSKRTPHYTLQRTDPTPLYIDRLFLLNARFVLPMTGTPPPLPPFRPTILISIHEMRIIIYFVHDSYFFSFKGRAAHPHVMCRRMEEKNRKIVRVYLKSNKHTINSSTK